MTHTTVDASELDFRRENLAMAEGSVHPITVLPGAFIPTTEEMNGAIILNTLASASSINSVAQYLSNCVYAGILHRVFDHAGYWRKDMFTLFMANHLVSKLDLPSKKTGGFDVYIHRVINSTEIQFYLIRRHQKSLAIGVVMYSTHDSKRNRNYLIDYHCFRDTRKAVCDEKNHNDALWLVRMGEELEVPMDFNMDTETIGFPTRNPYIVHSPTRAPLVVLTEVAKTFAESAGKADTVYVGGDYVFFETADSVSVQLGYRIKRGHDGVLGVDVNVTIIFSDDQHSLSDVTMTFLRKDITVEMERALTFIPEPHKPLHKPLPWYRRIFRNKNA